ncbi:MAG TPA: hypothetical protein VHG91_08235 [Longimicrobium sp.]|nr:hypothetical protein [Longimicrobium sp.]
MTQLTIRNISDHPRRGFATAEYTPGKKPLPDGALVARGPGGAEFPAQLDPHPHDAARRVLAVLVDRDVPAHGANPPVLTLQPGAAGLPGPWPRVEVEPTGFRLVNDRLNVWVNLGALNGEPWFAGAASSVQLSDDFFHRLEMLDAINAIWDWRHDPEKRLQLDRIRLWRAAWDPDPCLDVELFETPFRMGVSAEGPARATATLESEPFDYASRDPDGTPRRFRCTLYRTFSLYRDADFVHEHLYVRGVPEGKAGAGEVRLSFTARYFLYMGMGIRPLITHFADIPDWLAVSYPQHPLHGYGFATNVHADPIRNPHPGYPHPTHDHNSFSWELGAGNDVHCVHLFRCAPAGEMVEATGRAWYCHIYHPLTAELSL